MLLPVADRFPFPLPTQLVWPIHGAFDHSLPP
jgi:hypothetical protein